MTKEEVFDIHQKLEKLRENHIHIVIRRYCIGSDEWVFGYAVEYLPKEYWDAKRRSVHFVDIKHSFQESPGGTYWGGWDTHEEATNEAIKYAMTLL